MLASAIKVGNSKLLGVILALVMAPSKARPDISIDWDRHQKLAAKLARNKPQVEYKTQAQQLQSFIASVQ